MADILELHLLRADDLDLSVERKIRRLSRGFAWLFAGLYAGTALLLAAGLVGVLFYWGPGVWVGPEGGYIGSPPPGIGPGYIPLVEIGWPCRLGGAVALTLQVTPAVLILANLYRLFRLYAAGSVFTPANAATVRRIGQWLIGYAVGPLIGHILLTATGTEIDHNWAHMAQLHAAVLGGLVFVIALVMQHAAVIERDRESFV